MQEAHEFLTHYRTFLSQTIAELAIDRRVALLHFDTNQKSMEQIVNKILAKFESPSQIDYPAHPSNLLKNSSAGLQ